MTSVPIAEPPPREGPGRRLSTFFYRHPRLRLWSLLALPLAWLVLVYFGSLFVLLLSSFWDADSFTGEVVHEFTLENFQRILEQDVYRNVAWRTLAGGTRTYSAKPPGSRLDALKARHIDSLPRRQ